MKKGNVKKAGPSWKLNNRKKVLSLTGFSYTVQGGFHLVCRTWKSRILGAGLRRGLCHWIKPVETIHAVVDDLQKSSGF